MTNVFSVDEADPGDKILFGIGEAISVFQEMSGGMSIAFAGVATVAGGCAASAPAALTIWGAVLTAAGCTASASAGWGEIVAGSAIMANGVCGAADGIGRILEGFNEAHSRVEGGEGGTPGVPESGKAWYTRHGQLANGKYIIDQTGMEPRMTGVFDDNLKSQWFWGVDAEQVTLDAANYADAHDLWVGTIAKVPVPNGDVGALGTTGEPTQWINVYRNKNGFVHGSPGGAG